MIKPLFRSLFLSAVSAAIPLLGLGPTSLNGDMLFGGLGGHNNGDSTNDGALGKVNQTTGVVTIVGHPTDVSRISGLDFDSAGNLFASTLLPAGGFPPPSGPRVSNLITLNPLTGGLLTSKPITIGVGGLQLSIADLAIQPGTNALFGVTTPDGPNGGPGDLYTINPATGAATFVGNTGFFFNSIAFAPNGTLYLAAGNLDFSTMPPTDIDQSLNVVDPANAAILSTVTTTDFFGALGVRSDGTIFGGTGDAHELFTIDPLTGVETLVGDTGRNFIGDLAFRTPDTGPTFGLLSIGLAALIVCAQRLRRSIHEPEIKPY